MLRELKTLIAVSEFGTFAAAGDRIGLSPSAVLAHVCRVEESLGKRLLDRQGNGRPGILNADGREAVANAREMLRIWQQMRAPKFTRIHLSAPSHVCSHRD